MALLLYKSKNFIISNQTFPKISRHVNFILTMPFDLPSGQVINPDQSNASSDDQVVSTDINTNRLTLRFRKTYSLFNCTLIEWKLRCMLTAYVVLMLYKECYKQYSNIIRLSNYVLEWYSFYLMSSDLDFHCFNAVHILFMQTNIHSFCGKCPCNIRKYKCITWPLKTRIILHSD